jgi:mono/diheme cytochrome c family protein
MFLVVFSFCLPTKNENIQIIPNHFDNAVSTGKKLFGQHCSKCHGLNGTLGRFGAKNLQESVLDDEQYLRIIQKGKGIMPAWEKKLTSDQISDLITYIKILK